MKKLTVFDESWLTSARVNKPPAPSWVCDLIETFDTSGGIYLCLLRLWFDRFPIRANKQKRALKTRLESFNNEDHLGAVNELACWAFMQWTGLKAIPLPTSSLPRPDFQVKGPAEFFVEVSTLNVSKSDKSKFESGKAVELNHWETVRRVLGKLTNEKRQQMSYAACQKQPCILVLFDYTTWSMFGTHFFRYLADFLYGKRLGFMSLPAELSAMVYLERKVIDGRIGLSHNRSAVYYNPNAKYPLAIGTFPALNQFCSQMIEIESGTLEHWIWL